jgi:hypothetical protein
MIYPYDCMKEARYNSYRPVDLTLWLNHKMAQRLNGSMNKHIDTCPTLFTRALKLKVWQLGRTHASSTPLNKQLAATQIQPLFGYYSYIWAQYSDRASGKICCFAVTGAVEKVFQFTIGEFR